MSPQGGNEQQAIQKSEDMKWDDYHDQKEVQFNSPSTTIIEEIAEVPTFEYNDNDPYLYSALEFMYSEDSEDFNTMNRK